MHVETEKSIPNLGAFLGDQSSPQKVKMKGSMWYSALSMTDLGLEAKLIGLAINFSPSSNTRELQRLQGGGPGGEANIMSKPTNDVMLFF